MTDVLNLDLDFDFSPPPGCFDDGACFPEAAKQMLRAAVVLVESALHVHSLPVKLDLELYRSRKGLIYATTPSGLRLVSVRLGDNDGRVTVEGELLDLRKAHGMAMLTEVLGQKILAALKPV